MRFGTELTYRTTEVINTSRLVPVISPSNIPQKLTSSDDTSHKNNQADSGGTKFQFEGSPKDNPMF